MNRIFVLLFWAMTFAAHAQVPNYVPTEGLVAWYPFNGNANDESGNGNHAVESANANLMPSFVYDSHWNREVIEFDDVDDELTVSAPSQLGMGNEFSFSSWLIPNEQNHGQVISMDAGRFSFFLHGADDHFDAQSSTSWASEAYYCGWNNHPYVHPDGWFHMTITISSDSIKTFGNGQFIAGMDCGGQSTFDTNIIFGFRNMNSSWDYHWGGRLADCGIWNRALTASEVLALYNSEPPIPGCTDPTACNFVAEATSDDGSCIPSGCMEPLACNYNVLAECEGEPCDYTCCPGPGCCADGTSWDYDLGQCVPDGANDATTNSCPQDLDFDGVVGVGDLMDLLSAFGTNCPTNFTCSDPVNYHGYDYATVQIGEQCWFAENLRTSLYNNDDAIPSNLTDEEWSSTTSGAVTVYGEDAGCEDYSPDGDPCDPAWSLNEYGRLYNWHAVDDERGLCPSGWQVPTDADWMTLEIELGLSESQANEFGSRGDHGIQMKTTYGWLNGGNGTNLSGYSGLPGGYRYNDGFFKGAGDGGSWWSSSTYGSVIWYRSLGYNGNTVFRSTGEQQLGFSIRCLQDAE